jgi:hypothetical protein
MAMSDDAKFPLGVADIQTLARAAGLNLAKQRDPIVHSILAAWLRDAHELNRKMSQRQHWGILPLTVFVHPRK